MSALVQDLVLSWGSTDLVYLPGRDPEVGLEVLLDDATYRFATRAMAGTAFIEGRVIAGGWGETARELSDEQGNHAKGRATAVLNDDDGFFRGLLAGEDSQFFENREASQHLYSRDGRFAGTSRRLFRGRIADVQVSQSVTPTRHRRMATLSLEDALGVYLDRQIPRHVFTDTDFPGIDPRLIGKPIPLVGGEHSDEGVEDALGNAVTKGLVPAIYVGPRRTVDDNPTTGVPALLAAPTLSVVMVGPTGTTPYTYGVTGRSENGETTLSNVVTVYGPGVLSGTNYPRLLWNDTSGSTGTVVYGRDNATPVRRLAVLATGVTEYNDTGAATEHPPGPPAINTAQIPASDGSFFWDFYVIGLGVIPIEHLYGSDVAQGTAPSRVNLDATAGVDVLMPGFTGWPHAQQYVQLPSGLWITGFYARGPRSYHHVTGVLTFAVQTCGYEDVGDGSGDSIQEAFPLFQHFLNEFVLKDEGATYRSGLWGPLETYTDGASILHTSKFETCQALTQFWLGTPEGYLGAFYLSEPITVREFIRLFNQTFGSFSATNHHGQFYPVLVDDTAALDAGRVYRERIEIARLLDPFIDRTQIENPVRFQYDWDPDGRRYRSEVESVYDETAALAQRGQQRDRGVRECPYSRDADTVRDAQLRWHRRMKYARRLQGFVTNYTGTNDEPGDQILIGHRDMIGDGTITLVPHLVVAHIVDANTDEVTMVGLNLTKILEGVPSRSPSASLSPSSSASPSASLSPTLSTSASPSASPSPTGSPSASVSPSVSPTLSPSASASPSSSVSRSPSPTGSPSASVSPSASTSPSSTPSPSPSPSASVSRSPSPSSSVSPSPSPSASVSPSASLSPSSSASPSEAEEDDFMFARKTGDTTRSSTTTPTDDPHLTFPVEANKVYAIMVQLYLEGPNSSADWKFGWNVPSGATMRWGPHGEGGGQWHAGSNLTTPTALEAVGDTSSGGSNTGVQGRVLRGHVRTSATAGDVTLQWSQNTSDAGNSTIKQDSFIRYHEVP